jgi:hypothetical protein
MGNNKENTSVNHQDHGHQEGNQNNTPPVQQGEFQGQRHADNHNQTMSNMLNDSEEQRAGRKNQKGDQQH